MVYSRSAFALVLLLTGCPDDSNPSNDTGGDSGSGSSPTNTTPPGGSEGPCPDGGSLCGNECVFLGSDENNCGSCGNTCSAEEECIGAMCVDLDPCDGGPGTPCGSVCANLDNDPNHCGDCNNGCNENEACSGGQCVPTGSTDPDTGPDPTTTGPDPTTGDGGSSEGGSSSGGSSSTGAM